MANARQRREAQRRRLKRQQQRRMQQDVKRRRNSLIISIVGVLIVVAIVASVVVATTNDSSTVAGSGPTATPGTPTSSVSIPAESYPCSWITSGTPARQVVVPDTTTPPQSGTVNLLVNTSQGTMTLQLDRSLAPCAVESFVSLAEQQYYADTSCHRLVSSGFYVLQCGDPLANGLGGPGYTIPDEATGTETYPAGTIAMARTANPHSGGSQFFIVYKDSPSLNQHLGKLQYTVFGKVTAGLDVVKEVAAKGSTPRDDGKPILPLVLNSVAVVE